MSKDVDKCKKRFIPPTLEQCEASFAAFWKTYPMRNGKRIGKADCLKWWMKNKPGSDLYEKIIAWLKMDKLKRTVAESANIFYAAPKDPCRWLKKRGWIDDIGDVNDIAKNKYVDKRCGANTIINYKRKHCPDDVVFEGTDDTGQKFYRCAKHNRRKQKGV